MLAGVIAALVGFIVVRKEPVDTLTLVGTAGVVDGDSLTIDGKRVRLRGIDAPERDQICTRGGSEYPCGADAWRFLVGLTANRQVDCDGWERDRYGRLLAICRTAGIELNSRMVEEGWAVAYGAYHDIEAVARLEKRGLWAGEFVTPREWRTVKGGAVEDAHGWFGTMLNWVRQSYGIVKEY